MEDKTLIESLIEVVDNGQELAKEWRKQCNEVTEVYDGNYTGAGGSGGSAPIKTQLLFTETRKNVSRLIFPADFKYICNPSNPNNEIDTQASLTSQAILKHYWDDQALWKKYRKVLQDAILYNRGYMRIGFKPRNDSPQVSHAMDNEGANKQPGQPYLERVKYRNFVIEDGFESIDDAYRTGGKIAIRSDVHIDWVKSNKAYNQMSRSKVKPEIPYRGMNVDGDDDSRYAEDSFRADKKNKYAIIWEVFEAPCQKYPEGRYFVINKQASVILYKQNALPYKGIGFPVRELVFYEAQEGYFGKPLSYRSLNSLYEYELFETKIKNLVENTKTLILTNSQTGAEVLNEQLQRISDIGFIDLPNLSQNGQPPAQLTISPDTGAAEGASLKSLSRFKSIFSSAETTNPFQSDQIATQIRVDSANVLQEVNDQRIVVNKFAIDCARDMIVLTKTNTTKKEQIRITRQVDMTIEDETKITLDGDYTIDMTTTPLMDMSVGESINAKTAVLNLGFQALSHPQLADRVDIVPMFEDLLNDLGMPTSRVMKEAPVQNPTFENSMMVIGMPIPAYPTDNHIKHLEQHQGYLDQLTELVENPEAAQQLDFDYELASNTLNQHIDQHMKLGDEQSQGNENSGAWKQAKNAVNNSRAAIAQNFSANGAAGVQGAGGGFNG